MPRINSRLLLLLLILLFVVAPVAAAAPNLTLTLSHAGNAGTTNNDFLVASTTGTVTVVVHNTGDAATDGSDVVVSIPLGGGLSYNGSTFSSTPNNRFTCTGTTTVTCTATGAGAVFPDATDATNSVETITFNVTAPTTATAASVGNSATVTGGGAPNANGSDPTQFNVVQAVSIVGVSHTGNAGNNFVVNTNTGTVTVVVRANIPKALGVVTTVNIFLNGGLTFAAGGGSLFTCGPAGSSIVTCTESAAIAVGDGDTITFTVNAPGTANAGPYTNQAAVTGGGNVGSDTKADSTSFSIVLSGGSLTPTSTVSPTVLPTFPIPTFTVVPTLPPPTVIPTATLIPPPPTRTPPPRPANAGLAIGPIGVTNITVVVDRDGVNVRLIPAIGAEVIATVNAGFSTNILARSPDNQWVQILLAANSAGSARRCWRLSPEI